MLQVSHRWAALVTGVVLLVVVLSGVALVLDPEIHRWLHPELYRSTPSAEPIGPQQAVAVAERERPDFEPVDVVRNRGVWEVHGADYVQQAHVDPGSGRLLGMASHNGGVMEFIKNLHMCAFSCPEFPGHLPFLESQAALFGNEDLTVGGLILALSGLVLLDLAVSGSVLWWPGLRRMARGLRLRKDRYGFNYDLHQLVGMAAVPFLLMWAVTGAGFEVQQLRDAWYGLLPGSAPPEYAAYQSKPRPGAQITQGQAARIAQRKVPEAELVSVSVPDRGQRASAYSVWLSRGNDGYDHSTFAGNVEVAVDRYSGASKVTFGAASDRALSQTVWEEWSFPLHTGYFANGWWLDHLARRRVGAAAARCHRRDDVVDAPAQASPKAGAGQAHRRSGVSDRWAATVVLYALLLAAFAALLAARGRRPNHLLLAGSALLELALLGQAFAALASLLGGQRPDDPSTHGGYLAPSVVLLPAAGGYALQGGSRWDCAILACACLAVAVITVRLRATCAAHA